MRCPACGAELNAGARFCPNCGTMISQDQAGATVPAQTGPGRAASAGAADGSTYATPVSMPDGFGSAQAGQGAAAGQTVPAADTRAGAPAADPSLTQTVLDPAAAARAAAAANTATSTDPAPAETDKERRRRLKAEVKRTRQAYQDARKAAGKSSAPKVAAGVVLALALLAGGAGGAWAYMNQQGRQQEAALQKKIDDLQAKVDEAEKAAAGAQASNDAGASAAASSSADSATVVEGTAASTEFSSYSGYVGTWTGDLSKTVYNPYGGAKGLCYGAKGHPLKIDIKEIDSTGHMKLSVSVLYHGHGPEPIKDNDADTVDGDTYLTFDDVTSTFDEEDGFEFTLAPEGEDNKIEVKVKPKADSTSTKKFEAEVESYYHSTAVQETDTYVIQKQ